MNYNLCNMEEKIALSKSMSYHLRHGDKKNFKFGGFILLSHLANLINSTIDKIKYIVDTDEKHRYHIEIIDGIEYIRANQGHTVNVEVDLIPIINHTLYPIVVHGTFRRHMTSIKENGLCRMKRLHIHFAIGLLSDKNVKSGIHKNSEVLIYLDLAKAINDNIKFYISKNNVILSPGNENGYIHPKYFKKIEYIK